MTVSMRWQHAAAKGNMGSPEAEPTKGKIATAGQPDIGA